MDELTILTLISVSTTSIVGIILSRQIKSQKEIIDNYKNLVESYNPDKIINLHKRQIEQLKEITDLDIENLRTQVIELGTYVDHVLTNNENTAKSLNKPELFVAQSVIDVNMPHCSRVLKLIHEYRHPITPNDQ